MTPPVTGTGTSFASIVANLVTLVNNSVLPFLYALAFVFFMFGIVRYFFLSDGDEGREQGRKFIMYGLIGIFVLVSIWGLVNIALIFLGVHS